jgi:OOP family OmpA-OmpF porin
VSSDRLQAVGFGEEVPIDTNQTNDGRARNRRVEFNVSNVDCKRANP